MTKLNKHFVQLCFGFLIIASWVLYGVCGATRDRVFFDPDVVVEGDSNAGSNVLIFKAYFSHAHLWLESKIGWRIFVGTVIAFFGAALGSAGGSGAGGIFVPMLSLIIGFDTKSSTAISKCMIMGLSVATVYYNLKQRHPTKNAPLIDYDLALLIQPMLILGVSTGVTLNVIFAYWMVTILLITVFIATSTRSFFKGIEMWNKETVDLDAALEVARQNEAAAKQRVAAGQSEADIGNRPLLGSSHEQSRVISNQVSPLNYVSISSGTSTRLPETGNKENADPEAAQQKMPEGQSEGALDKRPLLHNQVSPLNSASTSSGTSTRPFLKGPEVWNKETATQEVTPVTIPAGPSEGEIDKTPLLGGPIPQPRVIPNEVSILENVKWKQLGILFLVWIAFLAIQIFKEFTTNCSRAYWVLYLLQIPVAVGVTLYQALTLKRRGETEKRIDEEANARGMSIRQIIFRSSVAFLAGVLGGLLGLGGGFLLGPLFLEIGYSPQVSSATATFVMAFSASMCTIEYYLLGRIPLHYAAYFTVVAIIASLIGQHIVKSWITRVGRPSLIIFILSSIIFTSAILLGGEGIVDMIYKMKHHEYMGFEDLCSSARFQVSLAWA